MGFLDFKYFKSNLGVQYKKLYLLTNLKLKVSKTYRTITYYVTHDYCSREKGKLTEMRVEEMRKIVEERVRLARSTAPQGSSDLLVRQPQVVSWGTKKTFNPESLITVFVRYRPVMGRKQDESCMTKYLSRVMVNGLQDPGIGLRSAFLPEGAPLLEYLAVYQEKMDSWKYPAREEVNMFERGRGLSLKMIQEVEVQEIIVGETSPEHIKEIVEWFWEKWLYTQEKCPTQVVSLDNEQVSLTLYDVWRMSGKLEMAGNRRRSKDKERTRAAMEEDRFIPVPAKIMLGDGFRFCLIISIILEQDKDGEYLINKLVIQEELLEFLEQIPVATGVGVAKDITDIEFFYSTISNRNLEMKGSIDLGSLAVLAGYEFQSLNMTALGVQVVGTILNKTCSTGDDKWGWKWNMIPEALRTYGLGDIRFGYMCYTILAGILLMDTFPDPDICCKYLGKCQMDFVSFFMEWVKVSLEGVEVSKEVAKVAESRYGLINSLRFRMVDGSVLSDFPPNRIKVWTKLIGDWPTITSGGCRFMIQARSRFLSQMEVLRKLKFSWRFGLVLPEITQELRSYARFGISKSEISRVIWTEEVPDSQGFELKRPESLVSPMLILNPEKTTCPQIMRFCTQNERVQKYAIWEWSRMNPNLIVNFIQRMARDKDFQTYYRPLYDGIRLIFWRIMNRPTIKVPFIDEEQDQLLRRQLLRQEAMVEKSRIEYEAYVKRADYLREVIECKDKVERSRWREKLPQLPEWKLRRKRKRELRKQEIEEGERKMKKPRLAPGRRNMRPGGDTHGNSESEEEKSEPEMKEVYEGADEKVPKCKRIIGEKAKKKGKKRKSKGGGPSDLMRMISNTVDIENYEYPGKKLTESDEEFEREMKGCDPGDEFELETQFNELI